MSSEVEGLSYVPGLTRWRCTSKEGDLYSSWSEVPENLQKTVIRPEHFPTEDQGVLQQLKRCVRVLPHLQNTGGFFVALLEKVEASPNLLLECGVGIQMSLMAVMTEDSICYSLVQHRVVD